MIMSEKIDIADVCTASYPSSFSVLTCKAKTSDFCSMFPTLNDGLNEEVNPPQLDDLEGSNQTIYNNTVTIDNISMTTGGGDWVKLYGIASFFGQNLASVVVAAGNMVLEEGHERPIAVVAHHPRPPMMWCGLLLKSFAGFRPLELVQLLLDAFVGGDAAIFKQVPTTAGATTE